MAGPRLFDRVKETTTTTGTGTITLAGAVSQFRSFTSVLSNGDTTLYAIVGQTGTEWEVGLGTFTTSGTTLARTTVLASSNSNAAVSFSSGTKDVFITIPADFAAQFLHPANTVANLAAFQAGRILFPSDGFALLRDTGSALAPWGPLFPLTLPDETGYSWVNQGSTTKTVTQGGIALVSGNTGGALRLRVKTAPGTPYTYTVGMLGIGVGDQTDEYGACWRESSSGKIVVAGVSSHVPAATGTLNVYKWTNETTFSASYSTAVYPKDVGGPLRFIRLADNGTNRIISLSADGQTWVAIHTAGRTDFMTANQVGFFIRSGSVSLATTVIHQAEG